MPAETFTGVTLARILRPRGLRGEVAAEILTDFPDRLTALRETLIECELDYLTGGDDDPLINHAGLASVDHIVVAGLRAVGRKRSTVWPEPGELNRTLLSDHYGVWADVDVIPSGFGS